MCGVGQRRRNLLAQKEGRDDAEQVSAFSVLSRYILRARSGGPQAGAAPLLERHMESAHERICNTTRGD